MATLAHAPSSGVKKSKMTSALHSPNFRLYFFGQIVSISGTWIQNIAQGYLVFQLTKSELWLGIVACATGLPVILMTPVGGVIVERVPRRTLLIFTQTSQMTLAFVMAALTFSGAIQTWHIVLLAFLLGVTNTLDTPARQLIIVEMVGRDDLYSGIAMNSIMNNVGRIFGPALAGILLVQFGTAWCFFLNGVSFIAVLIGLVLMKVPFAVRCIDNIPPLRQLREGLEYSAKQPLVLSLLLITALSGMFLFPLTQIMPAFADVVLHSADQGYAAMNVGTGIGAVIAGIIVGIVTSRLGYTRVVVSGMFLGAAAMLLLALTNNILLASFMTGLFGTFTLLEFVCINTSLQLITPDYFRGRVMSLYSLGLIGFTPFGALAMGAIANVISTPFSIALYGILTAVIGAVIVVRWPMLMNRHLDDSPAQVVEIPSQIIVGSAVGD